jgi:D-glycero-beta-D-manno-heptose-7-phosphate kinase
VTAKEIQQVFDRINGMKIMVIGDVMVDSYYWGRVERISPEAPIPVVSVTRKENRPGGAANVALNLQSLGAVPHLCSVIGDDPGKDVFMELLKQNHLPAGGILVNRKRKTTGKTRIIGSNQHLLRVDEEENGTIDTDTEEQFIDLIRSVISSVRIEAVIFEDYDKGVITPGVINTVRSIAAEKRIIVSADPKKRNFQLYRNIDLFKPNLKEMAEGMKMDTDRSDLAAISEAARRLQESASIRYLLITLSEMGIYLRHDGKGNLFPAEKRDIADVSGAGDTVISVATACLAAGAEPENAAIMANLAGGLVCGKVGVVPVDRGQLLEETLKYFTGNPPGHALPG